MKEENENYLIVKDDSIFDRFKKFFKMFFSWIFEEEKKDVNVETNTQNTNNITSTNVVVENTDVRKTEEMNYEQKLQEVLLEMQQAYENSIIREEDLSQDQIANLKELYISQINYLKDVVDKNQVIISRLKEKVDIINNNK